MNPQSGSDELNGLAYVSSSPDFSVGRATQTKAQDQLDLPALEAVAKLLAARKAFYNSNAALNARDKDFSVEQQLEITQGMVHHIQELENTINTAIIKARETLNGQQ